MHIALSRRGVGRLLLLVVFWGTVAAVYGQSGVAPPGSAFPQTSGPGVPAAGSAARGQVEHLAPFQLSPREQQFVDEILSAWERHSGKITTFECQFTKWTYTPQFGPYNDKKQLLASVIAKGELKYVQPDRGLYQEKDVYFWNPQTNKFDKASADYGQHWVCDGRTVWQVDARQKLIREYPLPQDMQGKAIADGPVPFMLFGAEASKLKQRYFLRERTDAQYVQQEIWLEAYPRWKNDAANFRNAQLIMERSRFLPYALRMYNPNGQDYEVYEFKGVVLNNPFFPAKSLAQPPVPRDWRLMREDPSGGAASAAQTNTRQSIISPPERQGLRFPAYAPNR